MAFMWLKSVGFTDSRCQNFDANIKHAEEELNLSHKTAVNTE